MKRGRYLFGAAVLAGVSFMAAAWAGWHGDAIVVWKGAGVALLAIWAGVHARTLDGWLVTGVMAAGATGDVLLEVAGLVPGAVFFLLGHVVAIGLYRRHAGRAGWWPWLAGPLVSALAFAILPTAGIAIYALALGAMAGAASASRFPARVAIGAWAFVLSDLLIFARLGFGWEWAPRLLVWPLYFGGQALIAHGIVTTLMRNDDLHHRL